MNVLVIERKATRGKSFKQLRTSKNPKRGKFIFNKLIFVLFTFSTYVVTKFSFRLIHLFNLSF